MGASSFSVLINTSHLLSNPDDCIIYNFTNSGSPYRHHHSCLSWHFSGNAFPNLIDKVVWDG